VYDIVHTGSSTSVRFPFRRPVAAVHLKIEPKAVKSGLGAVPVHRGGLCPVTKISKVPVSGDVVDTNIW
jgi:hypothetical protein